MGVMLRLLLGLIVVLLTVQTCPSAAQENTTETSNRISDQTADSTEQQPKTDNNNNKVDINKYISPEFHNVNNVYTLPNNPETEKFANPDFLFSEEVNSKKPDYTTTKNFVYDRGLSLEQDLDFKEAADSIEEPTLEQLVQEKESKPNNTNLNFVKVKLAERNSSESNKARMANSILEQATKLHFLQSFNETKFVGEEIEPSTTTRKSPTLTKPPSNRNNSYILNNRIETETIKAINHLLESSTSHKPTIEPVTNLRLKFESSTSLYDVNKRGSVRYADTTVAPQEPTVQENQIVPVRVSLPEETTVNPLNLASTTEDITTTTEEPTRTTEIPTTTQELSTTEEPSTTTEDSSTLAQRTSKTIKFETTELPDFTTEASTLPTIEVTTFPTTEESTSSFSLLEETTTVLPTETTTQLEAETTTTAQPETTTNLIPEITTTEKIPETTFMVPETTPELTIVPINQSNESTTNQDNTKPIYVVSEDLPEGRIFNSSKTNEETTIVAETETPSEGTLTEPPGDNKGTIAAIVISTIGAVCLILLAVLLYVMRKRQKRFNYGQRCTPVSLDDYSMDNISVYNSVSRRKGLLRVSKRSYGNPAFDDPLAVSHPLNFPALAKFSSNLEDIKAEYDEIPQITAKTTELPEGCAPKNRYANVIPLPETRVYLNLIEGDPTSDYINANFVTGPKDTKGYYIACQGPLQNTVDDFWRMIWEQQSKVVLMLTHLYENGIQKCYDYLPPSEVLDCHRLFGDFQVTLKKREVKEKYIISSLQLKNMVSNSWREITHFWYLGWPEKGIPEEANSLIAFLLEARSAMKTLTLEKTATLNAASTELSPVVVHCSPGTGRTGVAIACDIAIREFEQTRLVDIPKIVCRIRRDRASAVQTREQYEFIYKVVSLYATKLTGGALDSF